MDSLHALSELHSWTTSIVLMSARPFTFHHLLAPGNFAQIILSTQLWMLALNETTNNFMASSVCSTTQEMSMAPFQLLVLKDESQHFHSQLLTHGELTCTVVKSQVMLRFTMVTLLLQQSTAQATWSHKTNVLRLTT